MRIALLAMTALAFAGCSKTTTTTTDTTNNVMVENVTSSDANMVNATMTNAAALASINETSWEFTQKGKAMQESVDATGKYITVSGKEHIDHGTVVMKGGKACFTSAMDKEGEVCWTDPLIAERGSGVTVSDKGEKLPIKRTAYKPLTM